MEEGSIKKPKIYILQKIKRFKPVVFIKKNLIPICIIIAFVVSIKCGVWNIKDYNIFLTGDSSLQNIQDNLHKDEVLAYLQDNYTGINFFNFTTTNIENDVFKNIPYVKNVRIEKFAPDELDVFVEFYKADVVAQTRGNNCYLLTEEGIVLEQLCVDSEDEACCQNNSGNGRYFLKDAEVDLSEDKDGKQKLLLINNIYKIVKIIRTFKYTVKNITISDNTVTVEDADGKKMIFTLSSDIDLQLARYYAVMSKIKNDNINFSSLDVRFERPSMKN